MSFDAFELLPWTPGWKYEYWDGVAHITPRHQVVTVRVCTRPSAAPAGRGVREARPDDGPPLVDAYLAAFEDTMDYCDYERTQIAGEARTNLRDFFDGKRGKALPASRVAVDDDGAVIGAALLVGEDDQPPLLDMLFVAPGRQRVGVATSLVTAASSDLHDGGEPFLDSSYMLGNEASEAWHRRFGFFELPDLSLAQSRYRVQRHELWRRKRTETLDAATREALEREVDGLRRCVADLEARSEAEGWQAVHPILHRRRNAWLTGTR